MTATILECTTAEYLADPAPEPSLSSSIAKIMLDRSPAHARLAHPRLGGQRSESTPEQDMGTLVHRLVLGKGADVHPVPAGDWRTKAAREERAAARSAGKIAVLSSQYQEAVVAARAIVEHLSWQGVSLDGDSEVGILWQEEVAVPRLVEAVRHNPVLHAAAVAVTGMEPTWTESPAIWCRTMLDHVTFRDGMLNVNDLKTIYSAHPDDCTRSALKFGYDIQQAAYTRAAELAWPEYAGRVVFSFLFCEVDPPYSVTVAQLDATMRERGRRRWNEAVETWSRCLHTDTWPSYTREPVTLQSPGWLLQRESEAAAARGEDLVIYDD